MVNEHQQPIAIFRKITCPHCGRHWTVAIHPTMGCLYYEGDFSEDASGYLISSGDLMCPHSDCLKSLEGIAYTDVIYSEAKSVVKVTDDQGDNAKWN